MVKWCITTAASIVGEFLWRWLIRGKLCFHLCKNICLLSLGNVFTLSSLTYLQHKKKHYSGTSPAASQYILNFLLRRTSKLELTLKHEMWIATYFNLGCNSDGCTTSRNQWRLCCACPQWVLSCAIVLWSFWLLHWSDGALSRYKHWLHLEVFLCSQPHHFGPKCWWFCDYNK